MILVIEEATKYSSYKFWDSNHLVNKKKWIIDEQIPLVISIRHYPFF